MEVLIKQMAQEYFHAPNLECITFVEDDGASGYIGTHSKAISGQIKCKDDQQLSEYVFVKYYTTDQSSDFDLRPSFENEMLFYQQICPFLESVRSIHHLVPTFLAAKVQSNEAADTIAIMMRRLGPEWVCHHMQALDYDHMSKMVRKLGEFHAYSFAAHRKDPTTFERLSRSTTNVVVCRQIAAFCPKLVPILQRALQPLRTDPQYRMGAARVDLMLRSFSNQVAKSFSAEPGAKFGVLGHLSFNQSNVLFQYDRLKPVDMKIVDWQTPAICPLGADLMRTLYSDTDRQTRNLHWDRLLDDYHEALSSTFDNCDTPSRADIVEALKYSACAALFVLGHRVLVMNVETGSDGGKPSHPVWNDELLRSMFEELIDRGLL